MKELNPAFIATATEPVRAVDGHAFVVEAGVSIGGGASGAGTDTVGTSSGQQSSGARECGDAEGNTEGGVAVFRFANRIPLLFEGGGDVVTRTALRRIK